MKSFLVFYRGRWRRATPQTWELQCRQLVMDPCILAPNRLASIGLTALASVVTAEDALLLGVLWLGAQSGLKFPESREVRLGASASPVGSGASSELTSIVNMQRNGKRKRVRRSIMGCVFSGHVLAVQSSAPPTSQASSWMQFAACTTFPRRSSPISCAILPLTAWASCLTHCHQHRFPCGASRSRPACFHLRPAHIMPLRKHAWTVSAALLKATIRANSWRITKCLTSWAPPKILKRTPGPIRIVVRFACGCVWFHLRHTFSSERD